MINDIRYNIIELLQNPEYKDLMSQEIFRFSDEEKERMRNIIYKIKENNFSNTKEKGTALEELIGLLFKSPNFFKVYHNVRTSSNEIDLVVEFLENAITFNIHKMFGLSKNKLIIECKNYSKKVDVTWVGKFMHLINTHNLETGLIFSKLSLTGIKKGKLTWNSASGLIKKFYLKYSKTVICLTFDELEDILDEKINFLELCKNKISNVELDTDIFYEEHLNSKKDFSEFMK